MINGHFGWIAEVTEFERGWGCRSDGYLICTDKEKGQIRAKADNGHLSDYNHGQEFSTAGTFTQVIINDKCIELIEKSESGTIWVGKKDEFIITQ